MENDDLDEKLRNVYYNTANGGAYLSAEKIYQTLKTSRDGNVPSVYKIRKWMEKIDDYNLQKPVKRRIKRVKIIVSEPYEQYDADLMDVSNIQKYNNKTRFLLVVIDIFTRFLWIYPLKNKFGKTVADAFEKIFKHELQRVKKEADALWFVEKVLKWRRRNGQREGYVKFQDWDKRFCQWIPERDIVDF
ncbi:Hypothetical predicted protein [Mytilus galloprovincialis]|uniref:Tudor-knot domain-containing protein n=1 Tax=Mytilus galloprovincialis TaxID=29158 RepID=A0A8B6EGI7_MYTGA|nr:Hypothetical predicted protein [Mytilus galloprovincialis]